jgi:rubrerythrin
MSTNDCLKSAFAGESQANRKYTAYAKKADQDGLPGVARLFRAAAAAETVHALAHFRALGGVKTTLANLQDGLAGENYEVKEMYPPFVAEAKKEGHAAGERSMAYALAVEKVHAELYAKAIEAVKAGKDFPVQTFFVCPVCGYTVAGAAPAKCPVCDSLKFDEVK